jgi:hypothetical protein
MGLSPVLARFTAIRFDSCSDGGRNRTVHFNKLPNFEQSRSKAFRLEARASANGLKIRAATEKKFLSFSLGSQASIPPIFYG